jgi:hypothetical protein
VLGRFAERRHTEQKTDGGVILAFGILLAYLFFSAPPYLTFPWLLGVGVVGTSGYFGLMALRLTRGWLTAASVVALVFVFLAVRMISRAAQEQYLNLLK